jgi:glycosyltransferase involved in cell wall biosynthesis
MKKICYLIPFYNAYDDLIITLNSLTEGVDVLIVDDGSKMPLQDELITHNYSYNIKIITAEQNVGIENALNLGLEFIYGKYEFVARLDCGDKSSADRIEKQLAFLNQNNDVVLVGSWARFVDESYSLLFINELPAENNVINNKMYLNNMFMHPSVVIRTDTLKLVGGYPTNRKAAEDYAVFFKLMKVGKVANIAQPLIDYVVVENSISSQNRTIQVVNRLKVIWDNKVLNKYCIYGLVRSLIILLIPRRVTTLLRQLIKAY